MAIQYLLDDRTGEPDAHLQSSTDISDNLLSVLKISCAFPLAEEI